MPLETALLLTIDSYVYISYFPTIENYFLDFDTFYNYHKSKKPNHKSKKPNIEKENLKAQYIQAAKSIRYDQAVRHTLGKLRVPTDFGTNIAEKSGTLPSQLDLDYCKKQAWQKIEVSQLKTNNWSRENFEATLQEFVNKFDDDFIETLQFLPWFQGKDFAKALSREFDAFSPSNFYKTAKKDFDYTRFKDLVQLRAKIKEELDG